MSQDSGVNDTRRYLLQTVGGALTAGLAGCSGDDGSSSSPTEEDDDGVEVEDDDSGDDGVETTTSPEVKHVDLTEWPSRYLLPDSDNYGMIMFEAWSPSQFEDEVGNVPIDFTKMRVSADPTRPYENVGFSPSAVPETYLQRRENGAPYTSNVKIDQLPGGVEGQDVEGDLRENGFEKVGEVGDFNLYSKTAASEVHAVSGDRHAVTGSWFDGNDTVTSQHREYLEQVLNQGASGGNGVPEEIQLLREELDPKDTFGVVNWEGYQATEGNEDLIDGLDDRYQPGFAGTTLDLEEGVKYGAWVFEDSDLAEDIYNRLLEGDIRNGWNQVDVSGRVLKATGPVDVGQHLNGDYAEEEMFVEPWI